jgi:hypothetical protein
LVANRDMVFDQLGYCVTVWFSLPYSAITRKPR